MPFSKYFTIPDNPPSSKHGSLTAAAGIAEGGGLQFQLPAFMQTGPPTLAQGGGAEVLPFNSTWFANNSGGSFFPSPTPAPQLSFPLSQQLTAPSPFGLPVYSASGFDVLSILSRVASRPNPQVILGPVDLTTSFVVVDVRRHDSPIVYCSPSFCRLTGYPEHEVLGRNCRFLQAPPGSGEVRRGVPRNFTSQTSVDQMKKAAVANKEVQTSIVNFRKDSSAFINLVSVIPIGGGERNGPHESNDVVYHVGFQVDLTEQPTAILGKLRDGSYVASSPQSIPPPQTAAVPVVPSSVVVAQPPRRQALPALRMAPSLSKALANPTLLEELPITTSANAPVPVPPSTSSSSNTPPLINTTTSSPLALLLLEYAPDSILVVSLKGAFLYVAPALSRLPGHDPSSLVGRAIADLAHPEDVVPLERQLKESSALVSATGGSEKEPHPHARLIDVLFRARTKGGRYVWVEARGRLHVEPGKGRKAIVLSARARGMPCVRWGDLLPSPPAASSDGEQTECWAQLSGLGPSAGAIVSASSALTALIGLEPKDVLGRRVPSLCVDQDREQVERVIREVEALRREGGGGGRRVCFVSLTSPSGSPVRVRLVFYATRLECGEGLGVVPPVVLLHLCLAPPSSLQAHEHEEGYRGTNDPTENIFAELEVRRGSSWQYELQQLRFANARLGEEVRGLEGALGSSTSSSLEEVHEQQTQEERRGNEYPPPPVFAQQGEVETSLFAYQPPSHAPPPTHAHDHTHAYPDPLTPPAHAQDNYTSALASYDTGADGAQAYGELEMGLAAGGVHSTAGVPKRPDANLWTLEVKTVVVVPRPLLPLGIPRVELECKLQHFPALHDVPRLKHLDVPYIQYHPALVILPQLEYELLGAGGNVPPPLFPTPTPTAWTGTTAARTGLGEQAALGITACTRGAGRPGSRGDEEAPDGV
ncbi:hypothetical protein DXG01_014640 [Tephrocybe rancida]|nr:hypothetical protein DXG01_014640 [Tephrocybe rancida]